MHSCYFCALRLGGVLTIPQDAPSGLQMTPPSLPGMENPGIPGSPDFILILQDAFKTMDCTILHAKDDADVLIVKTAAESAKTADTLLVMDDTDLLILLCYYADISIQNAYI